MPDAPRLFTSYSHDDQAHKDWVLRLCDRLVKNGVDVVLDQWDMRLGGDLPHFMETNLVDAHRVLAICSGRYVEKANQGRGGTGYEKMILTSQLMKDLTSDRVIPVIRNNDKADLLPTFLSTRLYADFRDDEAFEAQYSVLLRNIHGRSVTPRPQLGADPFALDTPEIEPRLSFSSERYSSPAMSGSITFDYSNNNGHYALGSGDMLFETSWSRAGSTSIHAYSDPPSIRSVALAANVSEISEIRNAKIFDTSSRARQPHLNELVVWKNTEGYYLATQVLALKARRTGHSADEVTLRYSIAPNKSSDFTGH